MCNLHLDDTATAGPSLANAGTAPLLYGFMTTSPNVVVEPIHPKAMPVILNTEKERRLDARAMGRGEGAAATAAG